ncbi:MAG: diguanylate cyclase, partial [Actinomycetota bacterium]|nr:diguanylate cyclase [Actinomycetota bacterium]
EELPGVVEETLATSGLDPSLLSLEITESALMDADVALRALERLKRLGVTLAVDDFGTGYSSLVYLRRLPVDVIKIDKSFVGGLGRSDEDTAIVAAVTGLAGALGLHTIAEGVETVGQRSALLALGCELGQGYLWHPPASAGDFGDWLASHEAADVTPVAGD